MKFLIALSILASSSVFANGMDEHLIKCYESPQQTERQDIAYVFEVYGNGNNIKLVYPDDIANSALKLNEEGCLEGRGGGNSEDDKSVTFVACEGEGQSFNHLVPVEIEEDNFEGTVYCQRSILPWFENGNSNGGSGAY